MSTLYEKRDEYLRWVRNEDRMLEPMVEIGTKTYPITNVVGIVNIWVRIIKVHMVDLKPSGLVFRDKAGVMT